MKISKFILATTVAALAVLATAAAALATPVAATTGVNVRSGPGTNFNVLDTLSSGEFAEVVECVNSGWCRIEHSGPTGWVYNTYLGPRPGAENQAENQAGNQGGNQGGNPANPAQNPQIGACFYTGQGHTGEEYCSQVGAFNSLGSFDNRIRSYKVFGGAHVNFCVEPNMTGACYEGSRSTPTLGGPLDNQASSLSIFTLGGNNNNAGAQNNNQNNNQDNQQADNQGNNAPTDDSDCSFALVIGPEGPTFSLTCGDNPIIPDQGNNNQGNNNQDNDDPVADAANRFADNEEVIIAGEGENENDFRLEPAQRAPDGDGDNIADQILGELNNNNDVAPLVFEILEPLAPIAIFAPGTPDLLRKETGIIQSSSNVQLDGGDILPDLYYSRLDGNDYVLPGDGAFMGFVTSERPTYEDCTEIETLRVGSISPRQSPAGTWFCLKTTDGTLMRIHELSWNSTAFQFEYEAWVKN